MPGYDDFFVAFERQGVRTYAVHARTESGDQAAATFTVPFDDVELASALTTLGRAVEATTADSSQRRLTAREIGGRLAAALFDPGLGHLFDEAMRRADEGQRGLRIRLSLGETPELLDVPWEFLYRRPTFLASQRRTPVVRFIDIGTHEALASLTGPVRILAVVANPVDLETLNVAAERALVQRALSGVIADGLVELDWLDPATPQGLRRALRDDDYHVLHFIGHSGIFDGRSVLALESERGTAAFVSDVVLANLLGDQRSLRLAVLNSCDAARTTVADPFASIATSLVALGVTAVVAMQFPFSDQAGIVFGEELYTSLIVRGMPIDAAVAEGRKAVLTDVDELEWATPVLFSASKDGRLFGLADADVEPLTASDEAPVGRRGSQRPRRVFAVGAALGVAGILAVGGLAATRWGPWGQPAGQASQPPASAGNIAGGSSTFGVLDLLPECPLTTGEEWSRKDVQGSATLRTSQQVFTFETTTSALRHRADGAWEWQVGVDVGLNPESPNAPRHYWWFYKASVAGSRYDPTCLSLSGQNPIQPGGSGRALIGFQLPNQPATDVFLLLQNAGSQGRIPLTP
jgi:hypothetical protein